jgi:hypothetical protein
LVFNEIANFSIHLDFINRLPELVKSRSDLEGVQQRFVTLLDRYQEQPHLLDPHLPGLLNLLVEAVLNPSNDGTLFTSHLLKQGFQTRGPCFFTNNSSQRHKECSNVSKFVEIEYNMIFHPK